MDRSKEFADWWMSDDAPQIIIVYLDGTQNRNFYHLDSENLGPHGESLINEVIPFIENKYRGTHSFTFLASISSGAGAGEPLESSISASIWAAGSESLRSLLSFSTHLTYRSRER